jgi:hypothetical protein
MRNYILLNKNYLEQIDFSYVLEEKDTLIYYYSLDELDNEIYTIIKWEGENIIPENIIYDGPFNEADMLEHLSGFIHMDLD